jgi:hypothetical protein
MPRSQYPSPYFRYLKARLWNLARPGFWGTAIFLSVVGLVIREHWSNPDFFTHGQKNQVTANNQKPSPLSNEDKAIAADIDNLPVLLNDARQMMPPIPGNITAQNIADSTKALDDLVNRSQARVREAQPNVNTAVANGAASSNLNPFLVQADSLLQMGTFGLSNNSTVTPSQASASGTGLTNQRNQNQNQTINVSNSLQTAINTAAIQATNQNQSPLNTTATNNTAANHTTTNNPATNNTATVNNFTANNFSAQSLPSNNFNNQTIITPQSSVNTQAATALGSTGISSTQPTAINQPTNLYNNFNATQPLPSATSTIPTPAIPVTPNSIPVAPSVNYNAPAMAIPNSVQVPQPSGQPSVVNTTSPGLPTNYVSPNLPSPTQQIRQYNQNTYQRLPGY